MTTYNTGNPVPSADARDRYDNSQTLDEVVNGDSESYASRTGKQVISLGGMNSRFNNAQEARESEFNLSQEEKQEAFQSFLDGTGWSSIGVYGAGVVITSHTQTVDYQGQPYSLKPSIPASLDAPYVTTGTWATEGVNFKLVGDNSLRQNLADPTIGPGILGYKNPGLSGIAGSDETTVGVKIAESVSLYDFGAVGGSADDSTHCYDALTWLYGGSNRRLILPPGKEFRAPQKLEIQVGSGQNRNCHLSGYGASLLLEGTGGIQVYVNGTTLIRGLSVKGLRTVGGTTAFEFRAADSLNFIFDASIEDCDFSGYTESGLVLSGNVFESTLTKHSSSSLNSTGYGVHLRNQGTGIISSVDVFGGTTRGGKHGLFVESPVNDFRMFGGTYLMAKNEGVRIDNAVGAEVFGTHVEMNWSSAGSLAAGGAGLHMTGRGGIHGVFGANSPTTFQQYVVSVFANDITITGGGAVGTYTKYGKYQQPSGGSLTLVGETAASYDAAGEVFPAQVGKLIKSVHISKTENFRNYAAAVTVDLNRGNFFRVGTLTGNVSIGNPSNRLAVNGEELKVALTQDSVGARTVTWGSDFASGITPIDATPFKTSIWNFSWTGAKWRQESFAASL